MEALIGCLGVIIILLLNLAFNFILMPYLLMIVLTALGYSFGFWVCLAFWIVFRMLVKLIFGR